MTDNTSDVVKVLAWTAAGAIVAGAIVLGLLVGLWFAFAAWVLWGWFVTPAFGVAQPSLPMLFGVLLTWRAITYEMPKKDSDTADLKTKAIFVVFGPALLIGFGWLVRLFV